MFGLKQIYLAVEKTDKDSFRISELARILRVSEKSAERYVTEAKRLGVVKVIGRKVLVDVDRLNALMDILFGNITKHAVEYVLSQAEKKGVVKILRRTHGVDGDATVEKVRILFKTAKSDGVKSLAELLEKHGGRAYLAIVPDEHTGIELYYYLRQGFRNVKMLDVGEKGKIIVIGYPSIREKEYFEKAEANESF